MGEKSPKELIKELVEFAKDNRLPVIICIEQSPNAMVAEKIYDGISAGQPKFEPFEITWTDDEIVDIYTTKDDFVDK
jgi:hypothetical protein